MNHTLSPATHGLCARAHQQSAGSDSAGVARNFVSLAAASSANPYGQPDGDLNARIDASTVSNLHPPRAVAAVAPSLRIAATAKNRPLLRWLRRLELAAWHEADARHPAATRRAARNGLQPLFQLKCR
jgi:hypothetical protein